MPRNLTDEQLALKILDPSAPVEYVTEASRRLREHDFRHLQTMMETVTAIKDSPLIDDKQSQAAEKIITSIPLSRKGFSRVSGLADRIMRGHHYSDADVRELAAFAMSIDTETRDVYTERP